jgi:hypothetical protein
MLAFIMSAALLSACGDSQKDKDDVMGGIISECQMNAHTNMEDASNAGGKKHFALGAYVEKCLREGGLQPVEIAQGDTTCFEAPESTDDVKGFIKPLQKCWKRTGSSKK